MDEGWVGIIGAFVVGLVIWHGIATNDPIPAGTPQQYPSCNWVMSGLCSQVDKATATVTSGTEIIR